MERPTNRAFCVALRNLPGIPARDRLLIEERFLSCLEFELNNGSAFDSEDFATNAADFLRPDTLSERRARWYSAVQFARLIALRAFPQADGAYFDISLAPAREADYPAFDTRRINHPGFSANRKES